MTEPKSFAPTLSVISAYYKNEGMTIGFLDNLQDTLPPDTEVVLVNAGSQPLQHPIITQRIDLPKNKSFANSFNAGLRDATGDYVCMLGNDVFPQTGWLERLVATAQKTGAMIVAPLNDHSRMANYKKISETPELDEVDFFPAVCWLLSREAISKIGLFDEVTYEVGTYEDNDYCKRIEQAGGKIIVDKTVEVRHLMSQTMRFFDAADLMARNGQKFHAKWANAASDKPASGA